MAILKLVHGKHTSWTMSRESMDIVHGAMDFNHPWTSTLHGTTAYTTLHYARLCYAYTIRCYTLYTMLCHAMPRYAMLHYTII